MTIEDVGEASGFMTPASINPEPIPIQVRVILVGSPDSYALLHTYDEDFRELFKVRVDFDVQQPRAEEFPAQYGRFIARLCREEGLRHFGRDAVAAVLKQACWWAEHQQKLPVRFGDLADLIREASHWPGHEDKVYVARHHVQKAIAERIYRANLPGEMHDCLHALQTASKSRQAKRRWRPSLPEAHHFPVDDQFHTLSCFKTGPGHGHCLSVKQVQGDGLLARRLSTTVRP